MKEDARLALAKRLARAAIIVSFVGSLAACQEEASVDDEARAYHPIPPATLDLMAKAGATEASPVLIRTFKKEAEFEIWKMGADGRYAYIKTFPMCRWSGQLGPKTREGDRQVPEGFYTIGPGQMNPNSHYYLSFDVGYPNAFDKAHDDTGGQIMVHGVCSSAGCFSMTDQQMDEIYAIAREAFAGGQREIQLESYPFHMTTENLAKFRLDPNITFWKQLKEGSDYFEITHQQPKVDVCGRHYVFDEETATTDEHLDPAAPCPALKSEDKAVAAQVRAKEQKDDLEVAALAAKGAPAMRLVYSDGGQNPEFANKIGDVSRPDALAQGPIEIPITPIGKGGRRGTAKTPSAIQLANAAAAAKKAQSAAPGVQFAAQKATARAAAMASDTTTIAPAITASAAPATTDNPKGSAPFYSHWMSLVSDRFLHTSPPQPSEASTQTQAP